MKKAAKKSRVKVVAKKKTPAKKPAAKKEQFARLGMVCDADTLRTLIRKKAVRVIDVRKADDYTAGHIPTAVSLPPPLPPSMRSPPKTMTVKTRPQMAAIRTGAETVSAMVFLSAPQTRG